jgi:membrane-bound inhibitor of C-type lysozyme
MNPLHHTYIYPATPHILWLPQSTVLANVSSNAATGRTHTLTCEETKLTVERTKHTSVTSTNQDEKILHF